MARKKTQNNASTWVVHLTSSHFYVFAVNVSCPTVSFKKSLCVEIHRQYLNEQQEGFLITCLQFLKWLKNKFCFFFFFSSKLLKRKKSETGLQGVTGEWFEEIQRKKFQNYSDVNRMLKPPLEHQLKKSKSTSELRFSISLSTWSRSQNQCLGAFQSVMAKKFLKLHWVSSQVKVLPKIYFQNDYDSN